jgi:predicted metalloprotease
MKWFGRRQSDNFERSSGSGGFVLGGIGTIVVIVVALFLGKSPSELMNQLKSVVPTEQTDNTTDKANLSEAEQFTSVVLADTEDVWKEIFKNEGMEYREPKLLSFTNSVQSGCGAAGAETGPFYCPADERVYIDVTFYDELKNRFNAPGDFAMAYVIAHEVGHHVQNLLGTTAKLDQLRGKISEKEYNKLSVKLELQADFYAGVWANHDQKMKNILEEGDIEEALNAATAIGDDKLQQQAQGYVVPDAFTHGTSAQRMKWFKKGFETGDIKQGDTFNAIDL